MERKTAVVANVIGWMQLIIASLLFLICAIALSPPPERQIHGQPAFERAAEKAVFLRLLAKHGLQYDVSIIYEDHLGKYFIRDGRRCAFK